MKKEYKFDASPFYSKNMKIRAGLTELQASTGNDVVLAKKRFYKQDEYVKFIIPTNFDIKSFYKLPNIAKTILQHILYYCLEYNNPCFVFKAKEFATILETDVGYIYKGINKLIEANIVAKTGTKELYWINHNLYYKGNFMIDKYLITK